MGSCSFKGILETFPYPKYGGILPELLLILPSASLFWFWIVGHCFFRPLQCLGTFTFSLLWSATMWFSWGALRWPYARSLVCVFPASGPWKEFMHSLPWIWVYKPIVTFFSSLSKQQATFSLTLYISYVWSRLAHWVSKLYATHVDLSKGSWQPLIRFSLFCGRWDLWYSSPQRNLPLQILFKYVPLDPFKSF